MSTEARGDERAELARKISADWCVSSEPAPRMLDWILTMRALLARLRELGFSVASCTWCSLTLPRADEAKCPLCESLVSRGGRRRFARPQVFGVPVPDGGLDLAGISEVAKKAKEDLLGHLAEAVAAATRPSGPKN